MSLSTNSTLPASLLPSCLNASLNLMRNTRIDYKWKLCDGRTVRGPSIVLIAFSSKVDRKRGRPFLDYELIMFEISKHCSTEVWLYMCAFCVLGSSFSYYYTGHLNQCSVHERRLVR